MSGGTAVDLAVTTSASFVVEPYLAEVAALILLAAAGLLQAIAAEAGQRSRSETTFEAQRLPDAYEAFRRSLIEGYRFFAAERMMFRQIISLAAVDPEAKELVSGFEQNRRLGMKRMADRLADEGYLRAGWSRGTLADLLWIATSFETFDLLHSGRGLSARVAAQRTLAMTSAGLKVGDPKA
jgi:hypothetical protein